MQRGDFEGLFRAMDGQPVTIRLLDPPLHEFLPQADHEIEEVAEQMGANPDQLRARVAELKEFNPMLGHRGCRLRGGAAHRPCALSAQRAACHRQFGRPAPG